MQEQPFSETHTAKLKPLELPPLPPEPLVSILIANYNYDRYIGEAIESVLNQTYQNFEIVVCDDGSTDDSSAVVERYVRRDARIKLIRKENGGTASALNAAYEISKGEIAALLDADDAFQQSKLAEVVGAFRVNPQAGFCIHRVLPVSAHGKSLSEPIPKTLAVGWLGPEALRRGGFIGGLPPASGKSFRREVMVRIFPLPLEFRRIADGYLMRAAQFLTEIVAIPHSLATYRLHGKNTTGAAFPTGETVSRLVEDYLRVHEALVGFLGSQCGANMSQLLRLEDNQDYWEYKLALEILTSRSPRQAQGNSSLDFLVFVPDSRRRTIWRTLLSAPRPISRPLLKLWWGTYPFKPVLRQLAQLLMTR